MATASELFTQRQPLADEILRLRDLIGKEGRDFTAEERERWDKVNKDYDTLTGQIQIAQRAEQIQADRSKAANTSRFDPASLDYDARKKAKRVWREESRAKAIEKEKKGKARADARAARQRKRMGWLNPDVSEQTRADALQGWCRRQSGLPLKRHHEDACRTLGLNPTARDLTIKALKEGPPSTYDGLRRAAKPYLESRAQALNANVSGGYLVPEGFVQNLEIALLQYSNLRQYCDVMRTTSGQDLPWPSANDTFNKGAILVENSSVALTPSIIFSQTILHAYKYTSNLVQVPVELMEDSAFDLAALLGELLGIRIARIQNDHLTTGTGVAQPTGVVVGATQGVQAASATAIAWDDMYKLKHAVDPAYRAGALWSFHDQVYKNLKLLKDGFGRYMWQSGVAASAPDTIDGDRVFINQSMIATIASGNKTVLYGQFGKYKVRDVSAVRMRRLVERYADVDQEGFVMFARMDGTLLDAGTHPIQYLVH